MRQPGDLFMVKPLFIFRILLISTFLICCIGLGSWGLTETSESRYAQISKEMYSGSDYMHPKLLDVHHYHKPPVTYYITALGYRIFGVNEFGARFFLQIALIIQLLFVYHIALMLFRDKKQALISVLIYFSLPLVLISIRNLTTDAYLNTFILGSIFFWLKNKETAAKKYYLYLFFIFLGLIMNTKGPVGIIFPIVFILSYSYIFKKKPIINVHAIIGFLLFFFISSLWLMLLYIEDPSIVNYLIKDQVVERIASKSYNRAKPFWFYLLVLPIAILPWLFPLIRSFISGFKHRFKPDPATKLLALTSVIIVFIFSVFSTKLILYILPVSGFIAILVSKLLIDSKKSELKIYNVFIIALTVIFITTLYSLPLIKSTFSANYFSLTLLTVVIITAFWIVIRYTNSEDVLRTSYIGYIFGLSLLLGSMIFFGRNDTQINSLKDVMNFIENEIPSKKENIVVYNYLLPSASFYANQKIITINDGHNTVKRDLRFEKDEQWRNYLIDANTPAGLITLDSLFAKNIVLITRKKHQLAKDLQYLQKNLVHKKSFDKWIIYY